MDSLEFLGIPLGLPPPGLRGGPTDPLYFSTDLLTFIRFQRHLLAFIDFIEISLGEAPAGGRPPAGPGRGRLFFIGFIGIY